MDKELATAMKVMGGCTGVGTVGTLGTLYTLGTFGGDDKVEEPTKSEEEKNRKDNSDNFEKLFGDILSSRYESKTREEKQKMKDYFVREFESHRDTVNNLVEGHTNDKIKRFGSLITAVHAYEMMNVVAYQKGYSNLNEINKLANSISMNLNKTQIKTIQDNFGPFLEGLKAIDTTK